MTIIVTQYGEVQKDFLHSPPLYPVRAGTTHLSVRYSKFYLNSSGYFYTPSNGSVYIHYYAFQDFFSPALTDGY